MNHVAKKIKAADDENIIFDKSIDFLKGQIPISQKDWENLHIDPKVRLRAFCVANQTKADYVYLIRQQLIDAMEKGKGISESWGDLKNLIDTENIEPLRPGYWETVYRTNMNTSYSAGKIMELEETKPVAIQLFFINDDRQSHICHDLFQETQGLALPVDHPFWAQYGYPPYHFNCRTTFRGIYKSQVARDVLVENPPMKRFRKFKPQEGFGGNPVQKESWWRLTENMAINAARFGIFNDVEKMAKANGLYNFSMDLVNGTAIIKDAAGEGITEAAKKAIKKIEPHEKEMAKILVQNKHAFYFTPRHNTLKSYDGILDGKIAELKWLNSSELDAIYSNINKADQQKANIVCVKMPHNATYSTHEAIDFIKDIFTGYHLTTKGKPVTFSLKFVNEVLLIDKLDKIWNLKKTTTKRTQGYTAERTPL